MLLCDACVPAPIRPLIYCIKRIRAFRSSLENAAAREIRIDRQYPRNALVSRAKMPPTTPHPPHHPPPASHRSFARHCPDNIQQNRPRLQLLRFCFPPIRRYSRLVLCRVDVSPRVRARMYIRTVRQEPSAVLIHRCFCFTVRFSTYVII